MISSWAGHNHLAQIGVQEAADVGAAGTVRDGLLVFAFGASVPSHDRAGGCSGYEGHAGECGAENLHLVGLLRVVIEVYGSVVCTVKEGDERSS